MRLHLRNRSVCIILVASIFTTVTAKDEPKLEIPQSTDPRLVVELFAAAPDIVHPVNITFDKQGRLLVIESHTHFPPKGYQGPKQDRIRALEDTNGDGKADRFTTFFEGTTKTMDIAAHPDGSIYLAERSAIHRLQDTNSDGVANRAEVIAKLDTKGDYPHNGLSGLAFDAKGDLYFGLGENLGASYKLIGSDGTTLTGEGEGGNIFHCTADGKKLRRVATGFWNPFGIGTDIYGRVFTVDNDPDAMPPCRLIHVVEGGDYGYQFRYGRSGRHPFQAWNGQLPGTLPMISGTGESPCEVIVYESIGLPREYVGELLVPAWADHRIERYSLTPRGASFTAESKPFIQGGKDFRPSGLAVAPDGSLFVADWVLSNYELHGRGAIWHIRLKDPKDPTRAAYETSGHMGQLTVRSMLAQGEGGHMILRSLLNKKEVQAHARAAILAALLAADERLVDLHALAETDPDVGLRELVVRTLANRNEDTSRYVDPKYPAGVRREAIAGMYFEGAKAKLPSLLKDADPFLRHAAIRRATTAPHLLEGNDKASVPERLARLLVNRANGTTAGAAAYLSDPDPDVRLLAAKWIADERLVDCRPQIVAALNDARLSVQLFHAYSTALARLDGKDVNENKMADYFFERLTDGQSSPELRVALLRLLPASHKGLTVAVLENLLKTESMGVQLEIVRMLNEHPEPRRQEVLLKIATDAQRPAGLRAEATAGLVANTPERIEALLELAKINYPAVRDEALRSLVGAKLTDAQRESLRGMESLTQSLVDRVLGAVASNDRPRLEDTDAWVKYLAGPADNSAGRRVFFHANLAACARCHRVDGRGQDVGPDLSGIGRTDRRHILEALLQPSNTVAPHYQVWLLETADGKIRTGMLLRTYLDECTYLDPKGEQFKLKTGDIVTSRAVPQSIMPSELVNLLTDKELRDLLAYLESRR